VSLLRVLAVDDEPLARERLTGLVRATPDLELVGEARNGVEALDLIAASRPDLVLVDVEMPGLTGFGVVAALDGPEVPGVIFVTAYDHYAVKAFDVGAIDYLLKPVTRARFGAAIDRARDRLSSARRQSAELVRRAAIEAERARGPRVRYAIRVGRQHFLLAVDEIGWLEAADNYLRLHAGGRAHLVRGTISDAESELDAERFVRIHRSTIVAIERIAGIRRLDAGAWAVRIEGGPELRVSRTYGARIRRLLERGQESSDRKGS